MAVDQMPLNSVGKVDRSEIAEALESAFGASIRAEAVSRYGLGEDKGHNRKERENS